MSHQAFNDIIQINEYSKRIEFLSRRITLEAINASLSARVVGTQGKGFAVVANELHRFSDLLNVFKTDQAKLNHLIIELTTQRMRMDLRIQLLNKTSQLNEKDRCTPAVIERLLSSRRTFNTQIHDQEIQLHRLIERMKNYCRMGSALAKNGLIEAAHCGASGAALRKVAETMGDAVAQVADQLNKIKNTDLLRHEQQENKLP